MVRAALAAETAPADGHALLAERRHSPEARSEKTENRGRCRAGVGAVGHAPHRKHARAASVASGMLGLAALDELAAGALPPRDGPRRRDGRACSDQPVGMNPRVRTRPSRPARSVFHGRTGYREREGRGEELTGSVAAEASNGEVD